MNKIEYLVGSRKINNLTLKPYDILICNFLGDFSTELENLKFINEFPDLKSLSFWCRKKNLLLLKKNYTSNVARLPVGLVFHISPSNIPSTSV